MACSPADVKLIFQVTDPDVTDPVIQAMIDAALCIIDEACDYADGTLKDKITCWLAAHLLAHWDRRSVSEKAADTAQTFQSAVGLGFNSSHYGQTAMRLDISGCLAELDKQVETAPGIKASMTLLNPPGTGDGEKDGT